MITEGEGVWRERMDGCKDRNYARRKLEQGAAFTLSAMEESVPATPEGTGPPHSHVSQSKEVQSALPEASTDPGHSIRPGDWVCTKNFQRQRNLEPRWREPRLVLLTTRTAVKVEGKKNWVHAVHCKKVPLPLPFDQWVRRGISDSESKKVPQFVPFSDARLIGTLSEKEDDDILQEAIPSHRRLNMTNPGTLFQNQTASGQERYNLRPRPKNL
ncbi:uncharacterized protein [Pleurodeles waltl]|uniref:uncharacterized protein isoform X1 n=1 Tax=Pleurodeles waltl TaxID=8319 RepID=UPI0037093BCA